MADNNLVFRVPFTRSPKSRLVLWITLAALLFFPFWRFEFLSQSLASVSVHEILSLTHSDLSTIPEKRKNIVIASGFGFHFDVYLAVAWTLKRVMRQGSLRLYTPWPYHFEFQDIINGYGLYNGEYYDYNDLTRDVLENGGDGGIDLIILGTCEVDMRNWNDELLRAWDARVAEHKFEIVCIVHNAMDEIWQSLIPEWSRRNAIRLLPISEHVGKTFRNIFRSRARSTDPHLNTAGLEYIPIDFHVPILDVKDLPGLPSDRILANAVIQGSFDNDRRDYTRILSELNTSLHVDPEAWGYSPQGSGDNKIFIPNSKPPHTEFKLHLVGNGWLNIPPALKNIIVFHTNLNYTEFYRIMGGMDVCIPAFLAREDKNFKYQASSSIAMCMETNVPILALDELRQAYTHINNDEITITRPAVMSEVQALKALRTGDASHFLSSDPTDSGLPLGSNSRVRDAVDVFLRLGWWRSREAFEISKNETWRKNEVVMSRILRDMW